jgi:Short C-terminal domain
MENNIGVGLIVGLTLASSLYVWSNEKFNSVQKTILLICIVFPPAQWLGILIVIAYNSNVESNTPERKTEKKLDTTISNLTELKEKGILTAEEYNTKIEKIENEKTEENLKNSIEYKQLKSLLDSRILTKEEFESKVQLLQSSAEKTVNKEETVFRETNNNQILKIIYKPNQIIGASVYIDDTEAPDGVYYYKSGTHKLIIENGKIKEYNFIPFSPTY